MNAAVATKLARLQAQYPHKSYSELRSMIAKRPRKAKPVQSREIRLPYKEN
jgi:hypothetical protein